MTLPDHRRHRAVIDAGGDGLDAGRLQQRHDPFRSIRGGDVDILDRSLGDGVAHAAANESYLSPICRKRLNDSAGFRRG